MNYERPGFSHSTLIIFEIIRIFNIYFALNVQKNSEILPKTISVNNIGLIHKIKGGTSIGLRGGI